ncbi:MAG: hypothetical protein WEC84_03600 [Candidatus Andersenbacteria bacterium]
MSHKKIIRNLFAMSVVAFIIAVLMMLPCDPQRNYVCEGKFSDTVGQPLMGGSAALFLIFLVLFFLPSIYFKAWLKYAAWFIPVAVVWISMTSTSCGGGFGLSMCLDKELATWWSSGIYVVFSFIVIGATSLVNRKRSARI